MAKPPKPSHRGPKRLTFMLDPVTRVHGHLQVEGVVEDERVVDVQLSSGTYRGFEALLRGRDPLDAPYLAERICATCSTAHALAACLAVEQAGSNEVPAAGRLLRNLMLGAEMLQAHIFHFYQQALPDYGPTPRLAASGVDSNVPSFRLGPELTRKAGEYYQEALQARAVCQEMAALFGGRAPHLLGVVVGGAAQKPGQDFVLEYAGRVKRVREFLEYTHLPLVYAVAGRHKSLLKVGSGHRNLLCVGGFPVDETGHRTAFAPGIYMDGRDLPFDVTLIHEDADHAWFTSPSSETEAASPISSLADRPDVHKSEAYTFIKAPTYAGSPMETGALARMWINDVALSEQGRELLKARLGLTAERFRDLGANAFSVLGRHIARAEEACFVVGLLEEWLKQLNPDAQPYVAPCLPDHGEGLAFIEAPAGALIHYLRAEGGRLATYVIISPSMWNCAPRNNNGVRGPLEQALIGAPVPGNKDLLNIGRIIRSFAPCPGCATH